MTDIRISAIEDLLGRGDRRLAPVIETAWREGAGMDAWFESQDRAYEAWSIAIEKAGLTGEFRKLEMGNWGTTEKLSEKDLLEFCSKELPWDHIDTGIDKQWLIKDLQLALNATVVEDCSFNACSSCGVCGPDLGHNKIEKSPPISSQRVLHTPRTEKICRLRVCFTKTNPMHYISHLDLLRLLERAFRRSQLPISFTGGFHPLPRLQIALALPLGVESFCEWMDIDFFEEVNSIVVKEKLQNTLPTGINILKINKVPFTKISLSQELKEAIWSFKLNSDSKNAPTLIEWEAATKAILNSKELIWTDTDKKGRPRQRCFKKELNSLYIKKRNRSQNNLNSIESIEMELNSLISPQGTNIKPIFIKHWLSEYMGKALEISELKRIELVLKDAKVNVG